MNKSELVTELVGRTGLDRCDAELFLSALVSTVTEAVSEGDRVQIPHLGGFDRQFRSPRTGRNPRTGEAIPIPARMAPLFKPAESFRAAVEDAGDAEAQRLAGYADAEAA